MNVGKSDSAEQDEDFVQTVAFIRGASTQKAFNEFNLLLLSASIIAYFFPDNSNSNIFANALLRRAVKQRPNFYLKYLIGQKMKEVEVHTSDETRSFGNTIELKSIITKLEKRILELNSLHRHFWKELMNELIDYANVEKIVMRCSVLTRDCDSVFNNILALYYNDKTVLRMYAQYLEAFKFNKELANEYYDEASSLEDEESVQRRVGVIKTIRTTAKNRVHPDSSAEEPSRGHSLLTGKLIFHTILMNHISRRGKGEIYWKYIDKSCIVP